MTALEIPRKNTIPATIEKFEGTVAHIRIADSPQSIPIPIKYLPENCAKGSTLRIRIDNEATDEHERKNIAREVLNQLLAHT